MENFILSWQYDQNDYGKLMHKLRPQVHVSHKVVDDPMAKDQMVSFLCLALGENLFFLIVTKYFICKFST